MTSDLCRLISYRIAATESALARLAGYPKKNDAEIGAYTSRKSVESTPPPDISPFCPILPEDLPLFGEVTRTLHSRSIWGVSSDSADISGFISATRSRSGA